MFEISSIYFNSAYLGPTPLKAKARIEEMLKRTVDPSFWKYPDWYPLTDQVRVVAANLLGCSRDQLALGSSVMELISHIANGMRLGPGDEVIVLDCDFPSMVLPWMAVAELDGFTVRQLELSYFLEPSRLAKELSTKTRFVGVSHVMFNTGVMLPVAQIGRICRDREIFFACDISQSFGGMSISQDILNNADLLVAVGYKWLLGPYGSALGYFSDRALERIPRTQASWLVSQHNETSDRLLQYTTATQKGARKFDRGQSQSFLISAGLQGSLELLNEVGLNKIETHNRDLTDFFLDHVPKDYEIMAPRDLRSNIVCLKPHVHDAGKVRDELNRQNIDLSMREGSLRFAFHFFNTREQVQKLIDTLSSIPV